MKTITNKTRKPLRVPLPRGKVLFLGPGKSGQIASEATEHAPLAALIASGEIAVGEEGASPAARGGGSGPKLGATPGHTASSSAGRRSGDR